MEDIKKSSVHSEDDHGILEEILLRGLSSTDATVMVVDMLMAGIDTVSLLFSDLGLYYPIIS